MYFGCHYDCDFTIHNTNGTYMLGHAAGLPAAGARLPTRAAQVRGGAAVQQQRDAVAAPAAC